MTCKYHTGSLKMQVYSNWHFIDIWILMLKWQVKSFKRFISSRFSTLSSLNIHGCWSAQVCRVCKLKLNFSFLALGISLKILYHRTLFTACIISTVQFGFQVISKLTHVHKMCKTKRSQEMQLVEEKSIGISN